MAQLQLSLALLSKQRGKQKEIDALKQEMYRRITQPVTVKIV